MTLAELTRRLREGGIPDAETDARLLISHLFGVKSAALFAEPAREYESEALTRALSRRLAREPLQYILGEVAFFEELYEVFRGTSPYREQLLKHLLNSILIDILERGRPIDAVSKQIHPIVRESILYMLTNPASPITLDTFSEKFGITKTYFSHLFHNSTGVSFKQYLTSLRMEYAKQMLTEKEPPIIDVGFECGFLTPSQFSRSFKAHTGMTPSEYRAKKGQRREKN